MQADAFRRAAKKFCWRISCTLFLMRFFLSLLLISTLCSSCFTRWVMSEKEIREHYANKPVKPDFITIKTDSVKLFCATTGSDTLPPLLLVHGAPGAWFSNISILDDTALQKHFQILAVSRPGYHKSKFKTHKVKQTSIEAQAMAVHEALKLNKSNKQGVAYGNSYGAPIALKLVTSHPGEFYHLVLVAGALDPENEKFWWFHRYSRGLFARLSMPRFINTATDEKFAHVEELKKLEPEWAKLNIPVTVIQGTSDYIVPIANFEYARRQLKNNPRAEFILIEGAGHLVRRSHPQVIHDVLMKVAMSH
jgi:pimeloyl-ACP methyl ester carboxylesterase